METHNTTSDGELLRHYAQDKCEAAFAQIGRRYAGLVYSACLRELHDPTLAEDAAQATFLLLAQKAATLTRRKSVAGWLFNVARLTSQNLRRQEARRKLYEDKAAHSMGQAQNGHETDNKLWEELEPHLNDALMRLKPDDREAALLRFFEGQSLAEVGARLGVSENTARMRIARALEKMRISLRKAGIVVSAAGLAALLNDRAAQSAPDALYHSVAHIGAASLSVGAGAAGGIAVSASALAALKGTLQIMAMTTTQKIGVAAGVALLGLLLGGATMTALHYGSNAKNPGALWLWSKPVDPLIRKATAPFIGSWSGGVEALDPASGQWNKGTRKLTFTPIANGFNASAGDNSPDQQFVFDPVNRTVSLTTPRGREQYRMEGFQEFAERGGGTLLMETVGTPAPATGQRRITLTMEGDTMSLINERLAGDQYRVEERSEFHRSSAP